MTQQRRWIPAYAGMAQKTLDPRLRGDDAAVSNRCDAKASCSWTAASLGAREPHVGLAPDDPVLFFLHHPPRTELGLLERARDQITLRFLAAVSLQELVLRHGLDALGDYAQTNAVRQRDDRQRDRLVAAVLLEAVHEALVDIDALDRQPGQIRQARVAGAEVVDRDRYSHLLELLEGRDGLFRMGDDHAFGDLEIEVSRWQAARLERFLNHGQPAIVLQLLHRQVHRQTQHHVLAVPGHQLPAGVAQHACTEGLDHPRLLGDRDELGRADDAALGVAPAQQRLDAERAAGIHVDLRLVDEEELVVHEAAPHVGLELQPRLNTRVHVRGIEAIGVAPGFLRRVHRRVRLFDEPVRIGCIDGVY